MKYYIIIVLLWVGVIQVFAQQPRLKQVNEYLVATGRPIELKSVPKKRYNLLNTLYNEQKKLMLTLPDLENCGVREIIPFGFRLSPVSEIELVKTKQSVQSENILESTVRPFFNSSIFSGVSYQFCDSVVYGITLFYDVWDNAKRMMIEKDLNKYFRKSDYEQGDVVVYSDLDYAVKLLPGKVEFYSLFHFPIVETFYPGVSHKVWYGPYNYGIDEASAMLVFYNQESKENNIQLAFKISYKYPAKKSFKMNLIRFILDDATYEFPLEVEYWNTIDGGKMVEECDTRTFIFPEVLRAMDRSKVINVELVGEGGKVLYEMPDFQRVSVHTAYEYFRWNVTNPMVKYRAW